MLGALLALSTPSAGALTADGQDWLARINGLRTSRGLAPLQLDGELTGLAQSWAEHMAATGSLSHTPNMSAGVSANWSKLGENVGLGPNTELIWQGFLSSPQHFGNLTDPAYTHVGIGVAWVGGTQFTAHRFMGVFDGGGGGGGEDQAPAPAPAPRPRPTAPPATAPAPAEPVVEAPPDPVPTGPEPGRVAAVLEALRAAEG
jgi:hypothetical protein